MFNQRRMERVVLINAGPVTLSSSSNSDDNMLKNIELFDKLSLRFNGRVLFIKDVIGDEICCWSFYGQGRKIAEVCCTSIVYATEKKQTKVDFPNWRVLDHRAPVCCLNILANLLCNTLVSQVEFPEARIYEETLNILLYESHDGRGPDNALLEATGGAAGRSHHLDEDDERERIERVRRIHIKRPDDRTHHHQWPFLPRPVGLCLWPWTIFAPRLCLTSPNASLSHFYSLFYQLFLQETTMRWVSCNSV